MKETTFSILSLTDKTVSDLIKSAIKQIGGCSLTIGSNDIENAIQTIDSGYDLVLFDPDLVSMLPSDYIVFLKAGSPACEVVLLLGNSDITVDVELMKMGAYDYLKKPFSESAITTLIRGLMEKNEKERESLALAEAMDKKRSQTIISHSPEMEKVLSMAIRAAKSDSTVLIEGASGTGKELIARAIHLSGTRRHKPFVPVNVASLPETLIESELFGHVAGAFTGAMADRIGRFALADGGTLFIDEVADLPPSLQLKLLRVLQTGKYQRAGENKAISADVRIIAATKHDMEAELRDNNFRADLYYKINVVPISIPSLKDHKADMTYLVEYFIKKYSSQNNKDVKGITAEAMSRIIRYSFPGNIRELENIIERGVVLCRGQYLTEMDIFIPDYISEEEKEYKGTYDDIMATFEKDFLQKVLEKNAHNKSASARDLCINERRLRYRLKLLGLE